MISGEQPRAMSPSVLKSPSRASAGRLILSHSIWATAWFWLSQKMTSPKRIQATCLVKVTTIIEKFDVNLIKLSGFGTRNLFNGFHLSSKKYRLTYDSLRSFRSLFQFIAQNDSFPFSFRKFCLWSKPRMKLFWSSRNIFGLYMFIWFSSLTNRWLQIR